MKRFFCEYSIFLRLPTYHESVGQNWSNYKSRLFPATGGISKMKLKLDNEGLSFHWFLLSSAMILTKIRINYVQVLYFNRKGTSETVVRFEFITAERCVRYHQQRQRRKTFTTNNSPKWRPYNDVIIPISVGMVPDSSLLSWKRLRKCDQRQNGWASRRKEGQIHNINHLPK